MSKCCRCPTFRENLARNGSSAMATGAMTEAGRLSFLWCHYVAKRKCTFRCCAEQTARCNWNRHAQHHRHYSKNSYVPNTHETQTPPTKRSGWAKKRTKGGVATDVRQMNGRFRRKKKNKTRGASMAIVTSACP